MSLLTKNRIPVITLTPYIKIIISTGILPQSMNNQYMSLSDAHTVYKDAVYLLI